jgi:hypothetical protein
MVLPPSEEEARIAREELKWDKEHNRRRYYTKIAIVIFFLLVAVIGIIAVLNGATGNPIPATTVGPG